MRHQRSERQQRLRFVGEWSGLLALDAALLAGLDGRPDAAPEVVWAWSRLCATDGRASVAELTGGTGWSHRHLVARFRDQVGLAPKAAARVLRFERSLRLMRRAELSLAEVAADAGYYDQAHLNRDFRAFAGAPPTAFLAARDPHFPSFQDAAGAAA